MKRLLLLAAGACLATATACRRDPPAAGAVDAATPPAAIPLFDGRTLTGWKTTDGLESWGVEEGGILALKTPGGGHVVTAGSYDDFELRLEFRLDSGADSGVYFHWPEDAESPAAALEIQIADSGGPGPPDAETCGALAGVAAPKANPVRPGGEWNELRLVCDGPRIRTWINGQEALDADLSRFTGAGKNPDGTPNHYAAPLSSLPRRGRIGFENGRFFAWYRNLWLRSLRGRR